MSYYDSFGEQVHPDNYFFNDKSFNKTLLSRLVTWGPENEVQKNRTR